ncbi:MAG: bifunctional 4-hydroxy-2-oxoglutarate aldolase/2-dehydro-3-deoxy-phosphogluconate aldolase [Blastocatellia bacterium]
MSIVDQIHALGIIPVVSLPGPEHALPLAEALLAAGLSCAEITFRTAAAAGAISEMKKNFPELLVGAGTVLSIQQAQVARDAGAEFLVSPGTNLSVVDFCLEKKMTIFPGVCTPTEIEAAMTRGLTTLKFFPAGPMGGVPFLKAVCAPYQQVRFIPTGGIDPGNIGEYLKLPQVVACGGSWMVKPELMEEGNFGRIRELAAEAVQMTRPFRRS